jgi:GNAT superfamily N-acetyltransferase
MNRDRNLAIRRATLADAEQALLVVRRSITQLCAADHGNDPATLEHWLANKTPEHFAGWLADESRWLIVAELDGTVRGVGNVARAGQIHLCYVEPGFERRGIGAAILTALEAQASSWGLRELSLESSRDARGFYAHHGYQPAGCAASAFGVLRCYPFKKALAPGA